MKKILITTGLALTLILTTGCAPKGYNSSSVGQNMIVKAGVVQSIKQVAINSKGVGNGIGIVLGAAAGGAAANHYIGGGTGKVIATAAGAVAGGTLGGMAGDAIDTNYGLEISVKLSNGGIVGTVLRQNQSTSPLAVGQAVNVFFSRGKISNISPR